MKLHHQKHHQAYVNGLNAAEKANANAQSVAETVALQPAFKFNGGGLFPILRFLFLAATVLRSDIRTHQSLAFLEKLGSDQRRRRKNWKRATAYCLGT
jgi:superoxide dismutase